MIRDTNDVESGDKALENLVNELQDKIESVGQSVQGMKEGQGRAEAFLQDVKERQTHMEESIQFMIERQIRIENMLTKISSILDK